jgi:hypothetical protein
MNAHMDINVCNGWEADAKRHPEKWSGLYFLSQRRIALHGKSCDPLQ